MFIPNLEKHLERLKDVEVAVIGDFCLDAYYRIDPEHSELSLKTGQPQRAKEKGTKAPLSGPIALGRTAGFRDNLTMVVSAFRTNHRKRSSHSIYTMPPQGSWDFGGLRFTYSTGAVSSRPGLLLTGKINPILLVDLFRVAAGGVVVFIRFNTAYISAARLYRCWRGHGSRGRSGSWRRRRSRRGRWCGCRLWSRRGGRSRSAGCLYSRGRR